MLRFATLLLATCTATALHAREAELSDWTIELGTGVNSRPDSDFTQRLDDLAYEREGRLRDLTHFSIAVGRRVGDRLTVLGNVRSLDEGVYALRGGDLSYEYSSYGLSGALRADQPFGRYAAGYAQVGLGAALRFDRLESADTDFGALISGTAGVQFAHASRVGWFMEGSYLTSLAIENQLDDRHDVGGVHVTFGLRVTP